MAELTITEFARMGGIARAKKLAKKQRREIAKKGAQKRWKDHFKADGSRANTL